MINETCNDQSSSVIWFKTLRKREDFKLDEDSPLSIRIVKLLLLIREEQQCTFLFLEEGQLFHMN